MQKKINRLRDLTPDAKNANRGTERGAGMLEASLREYGAGRSVLVDKDGRIIAGNKTVEAAAAIGLQDVELIQTDGRKLVVVQRTDLSLDDVNAKELAIADNRAGQVSLDFDPDVMRELNEEIDLSKFFLENELEDLLNKIDEQPEEAPAPSAEAAQLQEKWQTARGQIWQAGEHRLMCGDACMVEDLCALMDGKKASMINTDPPYGVSYSEGVDGKKNQKKGGWADIAGDGLREDNLAAFLASAFSGMNIHSTPEAAFYIWHASSTRREFETAMLRAALRERQYITWVKDTFVMGHSDYHWQAEPCFYAGKDGEKTAFYGDRTNSTAWFVALTSERGDVISLGNGIRISNGRGVEIFVSKRLAKDKKLRLVRISDGQAAIVTSDSQAGDLWQVSHESGDALHPTQKPTELAARAIRNSSRPGDIVLDTFLGAGFTLMGAHKTGRVCYGTELDPKYLAVCLERIATAGVQPQLLVAAHA